MKEACPHCNNMVEGKFSPSTTRKYLTGIAKKGGMKAMLAAVGAAVGGIGSVPGFLVGGALDIIYGDDIQKLIDKFADLFDDNKVYIFECPNCGHSWTRKEDEIDDPYEDYTSTNKIEANLDSIYERVKAIIADKLNVDKDDIYSDSELVKDLGADSLDSVELVMEMEKEFGIKVPDAVAEKMRTVWDIIEFIHEETFEGEEDEDSTESQNLNDLDFVMPVEDVFDIPGRGPVVTGKVLSGIIRVGDKVMLRGENTVLLSVVTGVEMFRKLLDQAEAGDNCGLLLAGVSKYDISSGMVIYKKDEFEENYEEVSASFSDIITQFSDIITQDESEYIEELKACLENGEISRGERRLLEKLRVKLGISESRAAEIEASLMHPQLTDDEQEYLDEYKECLSDGGEISAGERRLLNRLRTKLGISEQRASELEKL